MPKIEDTKILIIATHGFERSELEVPLRQLRETGATVHVAAPEAGEIKSWDEKDWGPTTPVDLTLSEVNAQDYNAVVLPGGQINPDLLRVDETAMNLVREFVTTGKPVAAICHAPWLLIEAGALKDRQATSYHSIRTDVENAGAHWVDQAVVCDDGIITSRSPDDLDAFVAKIIEEVEEGRHQRVEAA